MRIELEDEKSSAAQAPGKPAPEKAGDETESLADEIREQQKKLRDMTPRERLSYILYYYKWHFVVGFILIVIAATLIHSVLARRDDSFYCVFLNVDHALADTGDFSAAFESYAGIDSRHYQAVFDTTISPDTDNPLFAEDAYDSTMRLSALFMGAQVDCVCCDEKRIDEYAAEENMIKDLSSYLSPKLLADLDEEGVIYYAKDPAGSSYPAAVKVSSFERFAESGCYNGQTEVYACLIENAPHPAAYEAFINFLHDK